MNSADADLNSVSFSGSMKAGLYTAQLGVSLAVTREAITLSSAGRSFRIGRENFEGLADTSILGVFKRGIRFLHRQPGVPGTIVFYPSAGREMVRQQMQELGWE